MFSISYLGDLSDSHKTSNLQEGENFTSSADHNDVLYPLHTIAFSSPQKQCHKFTFTFFEKGGGLFAKFQHIANLLGPFCTHKRYKYFGIAMVGRDLNT